MAHADESSRRFRAARFQKFLIPVLRRVRRNAGRLRILDVGGTADYWKPLADELRAVDAEVRVVNFDSRELDAKTDDGFAGRVTFATGDARDLPFPDRSFDLVHSNSVIEHVGTWTDMESMAKEVRRLAASYFVQVPYFWFPYEVHYRAPFVHWLPEQLQARLFMRFKLGGSPYPTVGGAMRKAQYTRVLDGFQFGALFPDGKIERERFAGLTKSLIAIRLANAAGNQT